ncbi:hypothetical protein CONPUDRAFT_83043, partial [Coniophora puteana RWD-64-598 SS2]
MSDVGVVVATRALSRRGGVPPMPLVPRPTSCPPVGPARYLAGNLTGFPSLI